MWTVFVLFAAVIVALLGAQVVAVVGLCAAGYCTMANEQEILAAISRPPIYLTLFGLTFGIVGGSALVAAGLSREKFKARLSLMMPAARWWRILAMTVGCIACSWLVMGLIQLLPIKPGGTLKMLEEMMTGARGWLLFAQILAIGIIGPLGEELLFRGYIQTRLTKRWGPVASIAITSVFFGLLHMDPIQSPYAALMGVFLGYSAHLSKSIWPAYYGHLANNTFSVLVMAFGATDEGMAGTSETLVLIGIAGAVLAVCVFVMVFRHPERRKE